MSNVNCRHDSQTIVTRNPGGKWKERLPASVSLVPASTRDFPFLCSFFLSTSHRHFFRPLSSFSSVQSLEPLPFLSVFSFRFSLLAIQSPHFRITVTLPHPQYLIPPAVPTVHLDTSFLFFSSLPYQSSSPIPPNASPCFLQFYPRCSTKRRPLPFFHRADAPGRLLEATFPPVSYPSSP